MERYDIGFVVPVFSDYRPRDLTRLIRSIRHSQSDVTYTIRATNDHGQSLARARNRGIRLLLNSCDVIACIDGDLIVPPGLIDKCYKSVMNTGCNYWARMRDVDYNDDFLYFFRLPDKQWDEWMEMGTLREGGRGSWNAMRPEEWIKSGGFDERCWGWGGEDDVFHHTIAQKGIPTFREDRFCLAHPRHEKRDWPNRAEKNLAIAKPTEWNWLKPNGHCTFYVTTQCNRDCVQCSARGIMKAQPNYEMTRDDVDAWIQATRDSNYRFETVIIIGGEPLMWEPLEYTVVKLIESGLVGHIKLFTNGDFAASLTDTAAENIEEIVISRHETEDRGEPIFERFPDRTRVVDRSQHIVTPTKQLPDTLPANCICGLNFMYFDKRMHVCPMAATNFLATGTDGTSVQLRRGYLDRLMSEDRYNWPMCMACPSNNQVRKLVGSVHA